jgi:hypothetical protein
LEQSQPVEENLVAELLRTVTNLGTTIIIADNKSGPSNTTAPGLPFSVKTGGTEMAVSSDFSWTPEKEPKA